GIGLASARAGNVIGGGDWADDRLIPDILRAFECKNPVVIRNPKSTRPWQHVLEPLSGYLVLAQKLYSEPTKYAEGWNFGPFEGDAKPVDWILNKMTALWPNSAWQLDNEAHPHEAGYLKLDVSKAKKHLGWSPSWRLEHTLTRIIQWHQAWLNQQDMQQACTNEINDFMRDMNNADN
ncbi:MAG: CDP-glucose 4,6-dehydratase, partial [Paraglaciecola sp.]|nr:CDP-glucose 4,6-dehydratase [Paraglaciecola sp.]